MQKIINAIACITFVLTLGSITTVYFGYKYITSPKGQEKIKKQILDEITGKMPNLINKELPEFTKPALPMQPKTKLSI